MSKVLNRPLRIHTNGEGALFVNGVEVIDKDGKVVADITAPAGSIGTTELASAAVTLAKLASGITPSHVVKFAGTYTTAGGAASEDITVTGAAATDIVSATLRQKGATPRTILTALAATDKITLTFSGDPSTDHKVDYVVFRAAA